MNLIGYLINCFAFSSNADTTNLLIFGQNLTTWLIYTVIFLVVTSLAFVGTWALDFFREGTNSNNGKTQPWE